MEKDFDPQFPRRWDPHIQNFPAMAYRPNNLLLNSLPSSFHSSLGSAAEEEGPVWANPNPETAHGDARRRFLVFDQSGNQTRLVYSSSANASWLLKPSTAPIDPTPFLGDECVQENNEGMEMHQEDSEELDALLYSDDSDSDSDSDSSGDEVISSGHSPSKHGNKPGEEGPTKRQKLLEGHYAPFGRSELEDDAESSCGNTNNCRKRSKKEKIRKTLWVLQNIVPGGKGKGAMGVIDETIRYLKSLKVEAESLRLDAL
ncbi:hypothetical protein DM860_006691 [Cuscuta australis]|uniref:BHLH domain-containing protein n=1 Tax=Cuscuta australis TaxID=267555 RepID=A0A328D8I6_9ASTE|nr:hypothetical protein DM860_006691 [Cuscuta australis]